MTSTEHLDMLVLPQRLHTKPSIKIVLHSLTESCSQCIIRRSLFSFLEYNFKSYVIEFIAWVVLSSIFRTQCFY